jgi:YidC/Oxa1 family membrane protein insertase
MPLQLLYELIFSTVYNFLGEPGFSIVALSLAMNFLLLPLYRRADAMQEQQRNIEKQLELGVHHIRNSFHGDEQMMMLQTYYRQNHYKPSYALRGVAPLLLEIPFFIAAYRFLSHLSLLNGAPFGPISDLSKPDALLTLGGLTVNILPILMTLCNLISTSIFTKGYPLKSKIQLYGMAAFFLVILYHSPSGLVLYWTMNNLFSLIKTIFYKLKHPRTVLQLLASLTGFYFVYYAFHIFRWGNLMPKVRIVCTLLCILLQLPWIFNLAKKMFHIQDRPLCVKPDYQLFFLATLLLAFLTGLWIPSSVIRSSPQEFIIPNLLPSPLQYLVYSLSLSLGTFCIWFTVFYYLGSPTFRVVFERVLWIACGIALIDYLFFGRNLGTLSTSLQFEQGLEFSTSEQLGNLSVLFIAALLLLAVLHLMKNRAKSLLLIVILSILSVSVWNMSQIHDSVKAITMQEDSNNAKLTLSRNGRNVVILMLDRALGEYVPYILNEKPILREQFSGFTWYRNTASFGRSTNFCLPSLFGGYDYTPEAINKRDTESLGSKHDEALRVLPMLFSDVGYSVNVCNPVYAGYRWIPDLSIYDDIPSVHAFILNGSSVQSSSETLKSNRRNFFCFGIMKVAPLFAQRYLYGLGSYRNPNTIAVQTIYDRDHATGYRAEFVDAFKVLLNLPSLTEIVSDETGTLLMMVNDSTHEPCLLQEPEYLPMETVDNEVYEAENADRFTIDGVRLDMKTYMQIAHYQINMASFLQLGNWFDYLREQGVYDNTRIILTSDHGYDVRHLDLTISDCPDSSLSDIELYMPLLLVKDFDAEGFLVSDDFMTIADVPAFACNDIIDNAINPYSGNSIAQPMAKQVVSVLGSNESKIQTNNGNTFLPGIWFAVHDDVYDVGNWSVMANNAILPTECAD